MAQLADEVVVGADAQIYVGDVGSAAPTNSYGAVDAAFADLGYVSEDGFDIADDKTIAEIRAMQSFYALRKIVESKDFRLGFTLLQWNQDTLSLAFGGATADYVGGEWTITPPDPSVIDERAFIFDWQDGTSYYRLYLPKALMTSNLSAKVARTTAAGLPIEISATPVSSTDDAWTLFINSDAFGS